MPTISFLLKHWLEAIIGAFSASLVAVTIFQVLNRYILQMPITWTEEAARFLFIWTVLLAAAHAVKTASHIQIEFIVNLFPLAVQRAIAVFGNLLIIAFLVVLATQGIKILAVVSNRYSPSLRLSLGYIYVAGPISMIIMIYYYIVATWKLLRGNPSGAPLAQTAG